MNNNKFSFTEILFIFLILIILFFVTMNLYDDYKRDKTMTSCIKLIDLENNNIDSETKNNKINECFNNNY